VNGLRFVYDAETGTAYSEGELMRLPTTIETVDVLVMESFPPQLSLQVTGYQPDGCDFPAQVEIRRDAETNTVYVQIFREMPLAVMCPASTIPYEASINLGSFDPGSYTIIVNEVETKIEL
jgi:inhibitor of cysteine peptidase